MRHGSNSTAPAPPSLNGGFQQWNSPVPYLFGGLALMLGLITMALIMLACSCTKPSSPTNSLPRDPHQMAEEKSQNGHKRVELQMEMEPKIVVIMAGDHNPTYFAKPAAA